MITLLPQDAETVWDIVIVLKYLSKLPDNLRLPIRVLSHKLALLLSLNSSIKSLRNMLFKY